MSMFRKNRLLWISAVGFLVLLNLVRWAPVLWKGKIMEGRETSGWMRLEFPDPLDPEDQKVQRNLFALGSRPPESRRVKRIVRVVTVPTPAASPTPSFPDGSVLEAAGGYRLMGVVSREGFSQALIGRGTQLFQVGPGDNLEDRYQVQSITQDEVYLTEKPTGNTLKLRIWDSTTAAIPASQANEGMNIHEHD